MAVKPLDREEKDAYSLKVIARDNALIPKQITADVTIIVDDKNDNSPQFEKQNYQQTVNNPTQIGAILSYNGRKKGCGGCICTEERKMKLPFKDFLHVDLFTNFMTNNKTFSRLHMK